VASIKPVISLIALAAVSAPVMALDIADNDVKLSIGTQLQFWAQSTEGKADTATFNRDTNTETPGAIVPYDQANNTNTEPAPVDFFLRRARLNVKGTFKSVWIFSYSLRTDRLDQGTNATAGRTPAQQTAYVGRVFKGDDWTSQVKGGLDYPFFNIADVGPSSAYLLPGQRATQSLDGGTVGTSARGVGVSYLLTGPWITWGFDILNNVNEAGGSTKVRSGLFYSTRVQLSPAGDWHIAKYTESFAGAEGHGILLGIEAGENYHAQPGTIGESGTTSIGNVNRLTSNDTFTVGTAAPGGAGNVTAITRDGLVYGADLLLHIDGLTALAEARFQQDTYKIDTTVPAGGSYQGHQDHFIWLAQAGYAVPVNGGTQSLELAGRYTFIDQNTEFRNETAAFGAQDYGNSGTQEEAGLNWYFSGHSAKLGLSYLHWNAESGAAHENIWRLQQQIAF
jgi:hypothetical protein